MLERALDKHKTALTERFDTPDDVLSRAFEFAFTWSRRNFKGSPDPFKFVQKNGACLQINRSNGGYTQYIAETDSLLAEFGGHL